MHRNGEPQAEALRIVSSSDGLGVAEIGNVCLLIWQAPVTPERFEVQRAALEDLVARQPNRAGVLCVIESTAPPPDDKMRSATIEMFRRVSGSLSCVVCVIESSGFRAATTRSVLAGMALLLSNRRLEVRFMSAVSDAAPWLESQLREVSAASLLDAHRQLRHALSG